MVSSTSAGSTSTDADADADADGAAEAEGAAAITGNVAPSEPEACGSLPSRPTALADGSAVAVTAGATPGRGRRVTPPTPIAASKAAPSAPYTRGRPVAGLGGASTPITVLAVS